MSAIPEDAQALLEYEVTVSLVDCKNLLKELFTRGYFERDAETQKRVREALSECDSKQQLLANKLQASLQEPKQTENVWPPISLEVLGPRFEE